MGMQIKHLPASPLLSPEFVGRCQSPKPAWSIPWPTLPGSTLSRDGLLKGSLFGSCQHFPDMLSCCGERVRRREEVSLLLAALMQMGWEFFSLVVWQKYIYTHICKHTQRYIYMHAYAHVCIYYMYSSTVEGKGWQTPGQPQSQRMLNPVPQHLIIPWLLTRLKAQLKARLTHAQPTPIPGSNPNTHVRSLLQTLHIPPLQSRGGRDNFQPLRMFSSISKHSPAQSMCI